MGSVRNSLHRFYGFILIACVHLPRKFLMSVLQGINAVGLHNVNVLADNPVHPSFDKESVLRSKYLHPSRFVGYPRYL